MSSTAQNAPITITDLEYVIIPCGFIGWLERRRGTGACASAKNDRSTGAVQPAGARRSWSSYYARSAAAASVGRSASTAGAQPFDSTHEPAKGRRILRVYIALLLVIMSASGRAEAQVPSEPIRSDSVFRIDMIRVETARSVT